MAATESERPVDAENLVARIKAGLDRTLIRESLRLSPEERILRLASLARFAEELREAGRRLRSPAG